MKQNHPNSICFSPFFFFAFILLKRAGFNLAKVKKIKKKGLLLHLIVSNMVTSWSFQAGQMFLTLIRHEILFTSLPKSQIVGFFKCMKRSSISRTLKQKDHVLLGQALTLLEVNNNRRDLWPCNKGLEFLGIWA